VIKNVQEYYQTSLKTGKPLCTEAFGVEPDVKNCNPGSEEDVQTSVIWPNETDPSSSSDEDETSREDEEVIESVKRANLFFS